MTQRIFFDLDGTLTDSEEGIARSIQYALQQLGSDVPDAAGLRWCLGPPLLDSFATLVGAGRAEQALALYRERFVEVGWAENRPYPGIAGVLAALGGAGYPLYVATSKPRVFAERILEHFDLREPFRRVFGSELNGLRTDKSELLRYALSETQSTPGATMIGDRRHDIIGALDNNMRAIGVTWGYGDTDELAAAGAAELAHHPDDLVSLLIEADRLEMK